MVERVFAVMRFQILRRPLSNRFKTFVSSNFKYLNHCINEQTTKRILAAGANRNSEKKSS
jgi:hypothetical protein